MNQHEHFSDSERSTEAPPAAAAGTLVLGDLEVNRIGFGAMRLHPPDVEIARSLLHRALELGVNLIDTADVYGAGGNETLLADALHPYPAGLVIATKGGQTSVDGKPTPDCRPEHLREACEASLRRLRVDVIDLYQLHNPDPDVPVEEALGALVELQSEGKIRQIGASNMYGENFGRALAAAPIVSIQNRYHLRERASEPEVEGCERQGIAYLPWYPLAVGELAQPDGELGRIAADHGATAAQVALAWLLQHSTTMLPIPGTSSLEHLEQNVTATALSLSEEEQTRLEADAIERRPA